MERNIRGQRNKTFLTRTFQLVGISTDALAYLHEEPWTPLDGLAVDGFAEKF